MMLSRIMHREPSMKRICLSHTLKVNFSNRNIIRSTRPHIIRHRSANSMSTLLPTAVYRLITVSA